MQLQLSGRFLSLRCAQGPSRAQVLAEVVVCAVGRVVTLPAMEMTAQATALLVLVPTQLLALTRAQNETKVVSFFPMHACLKRCAFNWLTLTYFYKNIFHFISSNNANYQVNIMLKKYDIKCFVFFGFLFTCVVPKI